MNSRLVSDMAGLPSGKTHRGKRSRGKKANPTGLGKHVQHFTALKGAMASGDHASAKVSALHLANALHSMSKNAKASSLPSPMAGGFNPGTVADGQDIVQGKVGNA